MIRAIFASILLLSAPCTAEAEELQGVAFDSMLVSLDGDTATQLLWNDCSGSTSDEARIECEVGSITARSGFAPACVTVEASPPTSNGLFAWGDDYALVRRVLADRPFIGADGARACHLETESVYRGLYIVAFEYSRFSAVPGEMWWLHLENGLSEAELAPSLVRRNMRYVCLEARGVALPPRQYGHGHGGAYDRGFFVTEVMRTLAPREDVLAMDHRSFNDAPGDVDRVCAWN
jgi:hypothetical protein